MTCEKYVDVSSLFTIGEMISKTNTRISTRVNAGLSLCSAEI